MKTNLVLLAAILNLFGLLYLAFFLGVRDPISSVFVAGINAALWYSLLRIVYERNT